MRTPLLCLLIFTTSLLCSAQNTTEAVIQTPLTNVNQKTTKKLILNISDYPLNKMGEMKDELVAWKEKIVSIHVDEHSKEFILIHNHLMLQEELFEVLKKYGVQKNSIITYK